MITFKISNIATNPGEILVWYEFSNGEINSNRFENEASAVDVFNWGVERANWFENREAEMEKMKFLETQGPVDETIIEEQPAIEEEIKIQEETTPINTSTTTEEIIETPATENSTTTEEIIETTPPVEEPATSIPEVPPEIISTPETVAPVENIPAVEETPPSEIPVTNNQ